jgi:DNA-binding PadR family transcriptional regulator
MISISSINLIILGLLFEKPMSAYEIVKEVEFRRMKEWVKISEAAIYKNVREMEKENYLSYKIEKNSLMPEKKIYTITEEGIKHFYDLLDKSSKRISKSYFDFNSAIVNIEKIEKEKAIKIIQNIKNSLLNKKEFLEKMTDKYKEIPLAGRTIIKQHYMITNTLIEWIDDLNIEILNKK